MEAHVEAMLKALVAVAWADGRVDEGESEVIEGLIAAFELGEEDAQTVRSYAKERRSLDDVPLTDLGSTDRRALLQHAVILSYVDGQQSDEEKAVLAALVRRLHVPEEEATPLLAAAEERAQRLLSQL